MNARIIATLLIFSSIALVLMAFKFRHDFNTANAAT